MLGRGFKGPPSTVMFSGARRRLMSMHCHHFGHAQRHVLSPLEMPPLAVEMEGFQSLTPGTPCEILVDIADIA